MSKVIPPGHISEFLSNLDKLDNLQKQLKHDFGALSPREIDIFKLVAQGLDNQGIADTLNISRFTVQNHRANIRGKIEIRNEADYYILALAMELIEF